MLGYLDKVMAIWWLSAFALVLAPACQGFLFGRNYGQSVNRGFGGQGGYSSYGSSRYGGISNFTPAPPTYHSIIRGSPSFGSSPYGSSSLGSSSLGLSSFGSSSFGSPSIGSSYLGSQSSIYGSSPTSFSSSLPSLGLGTNSISGLGAEKSLFGNHGHGQINIGGGHSLHVSHGHGHGGHGGFGGHGGHGHGGHGGHGQGYGHKQKVHVQVHKKKKKSKIITINRGMYIAGGTQMYGKFKTLHDCEKACSISPNCFAGDFDPWAHKCYGHSNLTACMALNTHPSIIHFKKVPCTLPETPRGLITLGAQIFKGLEQKGIKDLKTCIKKCATAGGGIAPVTTAINSTPQICFGIDYDFGSYKCYFHTNSGLCPTGTIITPAQQVAKSSSISILLCPTTSG